MGTFHTRSALGDVLAQSDARAVVQRIAPEVLASPLAASDTPFPFGRVLTIILDASDPRVDEVLREVSRIEDRTPRPAPETPIAVPQNYESADVAPASAPADVRPGAAHQMAEISFAGPEHGNPFVDVELSARFTLDGNTVEVGGFYDGDGRYIVRFLPPTAGEWAWKTASNARSLHGIEGHLSVASSTAPGPVRADGFHFRHANGRTFTPIGTTAYAWTHQSEQLQEITLQALRGTAFNKLRMGLFPKHFNFNENEPERFVFPRDEGGWDTTRFDIEFFRTLEVRLTELEQLGIQADVILFHPYDRWGFSTLGAAADERYVSYVVRRLAAFPNVWWSLANEHDLLLTKSVEDWHAIGRTIVANDPYGHPISIHNWFDHFDHSADWVTHCSIQHGEQLGANVREWRRQWGKPVVVDEFGYEGDLDQGWGFLTAEEEVARAWAIVMSGGYPTHGETYLRPDDEIFWAKGGHLVGDSPARLSFLRAVLSESPTGVLDPLASDFDAQHAGVAEEYILIYFGAGRPAFRDVNIPAGMHARIDIIDTWQMTIDSLPGLHEGHVRVELPARPFIAIRLSNVSADIA